MNERPSASDLIVSARSRREEYGVPPHLDAGLSRLRRGFYRPADAPLDPAALYLLRIEATAQARRQPLVFSHASAAVLWGAPLLYADMRLLHVTRPGRAQRRSAGVVVHRSTLGDDDVTEIDGLLVTTRERTLLDLARTLPWPQVLLPVDHLLGALNPAPDLDPAGIGARDELKSRLSRGSRGRAAGMAAVDRADARSGSAGESLSRGQMYLLRVPIPDLQVPFARGDQAGEDVVDFDWPSLGRFGEFDGKGKYFRSELAGERSPEEVLWAEKVREDRIRRHRPSGVRWGWDVALSRPRLAAALAGAGILPRAA